MSNNLHNLSMAVQEVAGFDKHWLAGIAWYLPVFTFLSIVSLCFPDLSQLIAVFGTQFMPNYVIVPLVAIVPVGKMFKLMVGLYGNDFSREYSRKVFQSTSTETIGIVLAITFSILGLATPWMTDETFKWSVIIGGFTIPPFYNILSRWQLGQSFIVSYFKRTFWKYQSGGAPFRI